MDDSCQLNPGGLSHFLRKSQGHAHGGRRAISRVIRKVFLPEMVSRENHTEYVAFAEPGRLHRNSRKGKRMQCADPFNWFANSIPV